MRKILRGAWVLAACLLLTLAGCGGRQPKAEKTQEPAVAVTCIAVLPAASVVNYDETISYAEAKKLRQGTRVLDRLLQEQFAGRKDIRFVTDSQLYGQEDSLSKNFLEQARAIANRVSCNAVLETTLWRYSERVGGEYTAKEPASVTFEYRLVETGKGRVLCQGRYDEVQKSVLENLYNLSKARERGFTWVTAEELMREGLRDKFNQCSYLRGE
ncbi:MAG TPA: hypothetical protein ENK27_03295 [Desulfobulbus sp.]|nr:hypothetical protein [Desulfobulbus sp.]